MLVFDNEYMINMNDKKLFERRTALRLTKEQRNAIDELIQQGRFQSLSQILRGALDKFLKN
jgi:Arc/MetJ-type ribon-helix-helix transcriptional regulator